MVMFLVRRVSLRSSYWEEGCCSTEGGARCGISLGSEDSEEGSSAS